ncbi:MAG: HDOD domain-containing protein [Desulfobacterales bacterium]
MTYLDEIEKYADQFPDMPPFCQNLIAYLDNPDAEFKQITEMVKYDPGLTADILKFANSSYFGAVQKVNSLHSALVRLGTKKVMELVIALSVSSRLLPCLPGYGLMARDLLKHSIWTAVAAQEIADILHMKQGEMIFTVGLMHDLGKLLLDPFVQVERLRFNNYSDGPHTSFEQKERDILGLDHAQAGAMILEKWGLSPEIVSGVRWHHEPDKANEYQDLIYLIHLANILALSEGIGTGNYGMQYSVSPKTIKVLGLKKYHIEYAASKTLDKMKELEDILG